MTVVTDADGWDLQPPLAGPRLAQPRNQATTAMLIYFPVSFCALSLVSARETRSKTMLAREYSLSKSACLGTSVARPAR